MIKLLSILTVMALNFIVVMAWADFGEIDLLTKESVEFHFKEYDQDVRMNTLQIDRYYLENNSNQQSEHQSQTQLLKVVSLVKAYNEDLSQFAWYECKTTIKIKKSSQGQKLTDLGSDCYLDAE